MVEVFLRQIKRMFLIAIFVLLLFDNLPIALSRNVGYDVAKFIVGVSQALFPSTRISAYLCIDKVDTVKLSREFSRQGIIHDIRNTFEDFDERLYDPYEHRNLFLLDVKCPESVSILHKANASGMFTAPAKWLLVEDAIVAASTSKDKSSNSADASPDLRAIFANLEAYPDSEVLHARRARSSFYELTAIYRPSPYRDVVLEDRGNWSVELGLLWKDRVPASRRRRDLQLTPLKSCLVMTNPDTINHLTDYHDKHVDPVTKVDYPRTISLVRGMNATVSFAVSETWGYPSENGSWSGMIGMLQRGDIDIGGTATFFVKQRIEIVEYIQLYTRTGSRFIFRQPLLSSVSNILTLPFQRSVWIAIGIFLLLVVGLLFVSTKWEYRQGFPNESAAYYRQLHHREPTVSDNVLVIVGAVAQQGFSYEAYRIPSRIVTLMLLVLSLSLYASYTANIVALLQSTTDAIRTISDLLHSPLKLGAQDVIYNRHYFKTFNDPDRMAIRDKIDRKNQWMNISEGIHRLKHELFAFHAEVGTAYKVIQETYQEDEKCGLTEIDYLNVLYPLLVIKKRSPYLEIIKNGALRISESGLQRREESRMYTTKPTCNGNTNFISIGFTECYFALLAMLYGTFCATLILLLEIFWSKKKKKYGTDTVDSIAEMDVKESAYYIS